LEQNLHCKITLKYKVATVPKVPAVPKVPGAASDRSKVQGSKVQGQMGDGARQK
jgi:hypothetical protein